MSTIGVKTFAIILQQNVEESRGENRSLDYT